MERLSTHYKTYQTLCQINGKQFYKMKNYFSKNQFCGFRTMSTISDNVFEEALSEQNINNCIEILKNLKVVRPKRTIDSRSERRVVSNAAVLVPFCHNCNREPSVLLTQRSTNLVNHRGEVCFPGGIEEGDDNNEAIRTAVRETVEELGVEDNKIKIYGVLNPFPAISGTLVHPVLGYIDSNFVDLNYNREEVEKVFLVTLKSLCDERNWRYTHWKAGWTTPVFIDTHSKDIPRVWGLTAAILYGVSAALMPQYFKFNPKLFKISFKQK